MAINTPAPNRKLRREFKRFVALWLNNNMTPLTTDEMLSFEEWIEQTPYSQERKNQLREVWKSCGGKPTRAMLALIKAFIKDETYPEYKFPRGIYSRSDQAKCLFGPLVQSVSHKLFSSHWFIKKIPVVDRPKAIYDKLYKPGGTYVFTDYTAFEAHFTPELMDDCENQLYRHMTKKLSKDHQDTAKTMATTKCGINRIIFKLFNCEMEGGRMSGEMDTSASNGFANLMLYLFASVKSGCDLRNIHGYVEGDDGLFRNDGPRPTQELFEQLGMTIKIGVTDKLERASFCGQIYDLSDLAVVTDVKEVVCRLGWTNKQYVRANERTLTELLRSRGYSLVYQYGRCPVLGKLGKKILELTTGVNIRASIIDKMDQWEKERFLEAQKELQLRGVAELVKEPGIYTRVLVEEMFDLTIGEQMKIEAKIESMTSLGELPFTFQTVPEDWSHYFRMYNTDDIREKPVWVPNHRKQLVHQLLVACALTITQADRLLKGGDDG